MGSFYPYLLFYSGLKNDPIVPFMSPECPITTWGIHLTKKMMLVQAIVLLVLLLPLLVPIVCGVLVLVLYYRTFCTF